MSVGDVPLLLRGLVDDAGLFPPEELSMPAALARHREDEIRGGALLSGRFLCPSSRLDELVGALVPGDDLQLALVTPLDSRGLQASLECLSGEDRVRLTGVEGPLGDEGIAGLDTVPDGVPCSVEVPFAGDFRAALGALAATRYRAKVRCGGARAELFPTAEELAGFVRTCAELGLSFKATAGLHRALPYRDDRTGFCHHGFLSLLLAACRTVQGAAGEEVVEVLKVTDAAELVREAEGVTPAQAAAARSLFVSYGACSTAEPRADLVTLGLLGSTPVRR
jgi:predicted small secreted protein